MKCVSIILIISLGLLALAKANSLKCPRACTRDYRPLCATWQRGIIRPIKSVCTFSNKCVLDNQICRTNQNWVVTDDKRKCKRNSPDCSDLLKE
ncbi:turripeptide Gsg9.2 [Drosophila gunungcola]|uniref:Uncharacterized protein n=1 Tax=Drosophila gunungcola TaxID=103775 RepID=A0A9P9Z0J7_9MUSC|nr:turripeptide Gsg9.2 [Drosophila gunungcola]KAI8046350.1 hypothetical protein M5D96_002552 [Drosophila gunungcola]